MIVQSLLGYAWINARLGEKECVNRSTGLLPSAQVSRCTVQYIYCMLFF